MVSTSFWKMDGPRFGGAHVRRTSSLFRSAGQELSVEQGQYSRLASAAGPVCAARVSVMGDIGEAVFGGSAPAPVPESANPLDKLAARTSGW